jgi:D-alanyl-D-alanine carboxypeptidase
MRFRVVCANLFALLFVSLVISQAGWTQDSSKAAKLDELLSHFADSHKFMGTVAVAKQGDVLFAKQYGVSLPDAKADSQADAKTQYRIGSITKTFTAVMIMQLVEEGKLSLDTKLSEFYPDLTNADAISIQQLLGHRSGLGSITDDPTYRDWNKDKQSRQQMMKIIAGQPKRFEPGTQTKYSNTNYVILGFIIEDLTKSTYAEQLQSRICERVGLGRTAYMTMSNAEANVARSFRRSNDAWKPQDETNPSVPHGAGAIMSTAEDLVRFAEALFAGKLVKEESLEEMVPEGIGMGHGLFSFPFGSKRALGHNGGIDGFQSNLGYFQDEGVAVAIIANGLDYRLNDILIGVLSTVFDKPYQLPEFTVAQVREATLKD